MTERAALIDLWARLGAENRRFAAESALDGAYYLDLADRCDLHLAVAERATVIDWETP